jgi:hypothetical protein
MTTTTEAGSGQPKTARRWDAAPRGGTLAAAEGPGPLGRLVVTVPGPAAGAATGPARYQARLGRQGSGRPCHAVNGCHGPSRRGI